MLQGQGRHPPQRIPIHRPGLIPNPALPCPSHPGPYEPIYNRNTHIAAVSFVLAENDDSANLDASQMTSQSDEFDEHDSARKREDEEDRKLGFRIVRITHCKNPSTVYIRSLELVSRSS